MDLLYTVDDVRRWKSKHKKPLAFVPTMGCLHDGHLSLIKCAQKYSPLVLMSIFVNPTQFNQTTDFDRYPRTLEEDLKKAKKISRKEKLAKALKLNIKLRKEEKNPLDRNTIDRKNNN